MRLTLAVSALLAGVALAAHAQDIGPPAPGVPLPAEVSLDPTTQPAGAYSLDQRHMAILWRIRHMGISLFTGRMDSATGKLMLDPAHLENSSVNLSVAANSVSTNVFGPNGERIFEKAIANQVLGAEAHPQVTFVSRAVKLIGPRSGLVLGDLTLNGVTKPAVMEVNFDGGRMVTLRKKQVLAITGRTVIRRSEFGAHFPDARDGTVGDEVEITLSGEFVKD
jgi:polyisoprenoid-binding protein YceI